MAAWQMPKASASFIRANAGEKPAGSESLKPAPANTDPFVRSGAASDALSAMPAPLRRKDISQFAQVSAVSAQAAAGEAEPEI